MLTWEFSNESNPRSDQATRTNVLPSSMICSNMMRFKTINTCGEVQICMIFTSMWQRKPYTIRLLCQGQRAYRFCHSLLHALWNQCLNCFQVSRRWLEFQAGNYRVSCSFWAIVLYMSFAMTRQSWARHNRTQRKDWFHGLTQQKKPKRRSQNSLKWSIKFSRLIAQKRHRRLDWHTWLLLSNPSQTFVIDTWRFSSMLLKKSEQIFSWCLKAMAMTNNTANKNMSQAQALESTWPSAPINIGIRPRLSNRWRKSSSITEWRIWSGHILKFSKLLVELIQVQVKMMGPIIAPQSS